MEYKKHFEEFISKLDAKMTEGHKEYGDGVFQDDPIALIEQLELELIDICGWGLILWTRLQHIKQGVEDLKKNNTIKE